MRMPTLKKLASQPKKWKCYALSMLDESNQGLPIYWIEASNFHDVPHLMSPKTILCHHYKFVLFTTLKLPLA